MQFHGRDMHTNKVETASECVAVTNAILNPVEWLRFRHLLDKIFSLEIGFKNVVSLPEMGGFVAWLHNQAWNEARS